MQKTSQEIFNEAQANMTNEELVILAREHLYQLCKTGGNSFTMKVPADIGDTDMIFGELIDRFSTLTKTKP